MKKVILFLALFFTLFSTSFAGEGIELNNINSTWTRVLPGKVICEPQMTSYGFAVITDARNLMGFTSEGKIVFETNLTKATSAFFGVLDNDFIAVVTNSAKRVSLLNPDGRELWNKNVDFKITDLPFGGRDGRFFVRGSDTITCFGINGIQKWTLTTPAQAKTSLQELPDGSLIVFLQQLDKGKTKALRFTPFGEIVEEITFAGEVTNAITTPQGILLVFTDGTSGLFNLKDNKSEHQWLFKKELTQKTNQDFFILSQDKTQIVYVNIKKSNVEIDYINLEDGSIKDSFIIEEGIVPTYGWYNSSGVFIADSAKACFYNNFGRYIWSGTLPGKKSKVSYYYTSFTADNCFLVFYSDWSIHAFRTALAPVVSNNDEQKNNKKSDYSAFYEINTTLLELALPIPLDKNLLLPERAQTLKTGNYGKTEQEYASQLLSVCTAYKKNLSTSNFGTRLEKSIFETDATGIQNIASQLGLFDADTFCSFVAYLLKNEANKALKSTLLKGVAQNGYDPKGEIMESLEYLAHNLSEKDETLLKELCDAVYSICRTMGYQAIEPKGKDTLSTLLYPKYTSTIRDYARNTLKKLVGK
ncbi:MAG: hypothetical protein J5726_06090 [Treponema sp.]|nr:hypothetical protein [Treponema sp.]